eukprot:GHVU01089656.1.p3 GENE.GHVU01089656.1~~GHVU01089656.1.p3  ORF type:complete len:100 (-),score=2.00 GHVU01089656.1:453-752(-)
MARRAEFMPRLLSLLLAATLVGFLPGPSRLIKAQEEWSPGPSIPSVYGRQVSLYVHKNSQLPLIIHTGSLNSENMLHVSVNTPPTDSRGTPVALFPLRK